MLAVGRDIRSFVITLVEPMQCYRSMEELPYSAKTWFSGVPACMRETPFLISADVLFERNTRQFVGVTYAIVFPDRDLESAQQMASALTSRTVRVNDFSSPALRAAYPLSMQEQPCFEIIWMPTGNLAYECAQLEYGAWEWFYPVNSFSIGLDDSRWTPPLGFGIRDLPRVLHDFDLCFPSEFDLPQLDFEIGEAE